MKRLLLVLTAAAGPLLLGACGSGEIIVQAQRTGTAEAEAEPIPLKDLTIVLLPYNRDQIFDSLQAVYPEPEPEIPAGLMALQDSIADAQTEWKAAEEAWGQVRDSLKTISDRLQGMSRAQPQYVALFRDFQDLEPQEQQLKRQMDAAFARFTTLQRELATQSEEIKARRAQWADDAFAAVDSVIYARLQELERDPVADTTDASGLARFEVKPGNWWVYARYELPYQELYWNVPVEVARGEPLQLRLTRENAVIRSKL